MCTCLCVYGFIRGVLVSSSATHKHALFRQHDLLNKSQEIKGISWFYLMSPRLIGYGAATNYWFGIYYMCHS